MNWSGFDILPTTESFSEIPEGQIFAIDDYYNDGLTIVFSKHSQSEAFVIYSINPDNLEVQQRVKQKEYIKPDNPKYNECKRVSGLRS